MKDSVANVFTEEEVQQMLDNLDSFSDEEIAEIDKLVEELGIRKRNQTAYDDLMEFCKRMQDDYIVGRHHRVLADLLMAIEAGDEVTYLTPEVYSKVCGVRHHHNLLIGITP